MIEEVNGFFKPTKISHREEQLKELEEVFERFENNQAPKNILCYGFTGSGKTFCTTEIIKKYKDKVLYIPFPSTAHGVLKSITDINYNTREKQRLEALEKIKKEKKIIIIDELNSMRRVEEIRWLLEDLKFIYRSSPFPLILITNKNLYEMQRVIPDDVRLTMHFNELEFRPYNPNELKEIFEDGISYLNLGLPEGFIEYLSAKINKDSDGSIRTGLFVLRECVETGIFTNEEVERILKKIQRSEFEDVIKKLPEQEKRFLATILFITDDNKIEIPISFLLKKIKSLMPQRISQLILTLESQGILVRTSSPFDKRNKVIKFIREDIHKKTRETIDSMDIAPLY